MALIDLNVDAGEGCDDEALIGVATSASLACGGHTGDPETLAPVVRLCAERGVSVGAQVSYVDRQGFGRRAVDVDAGVLLDQLLWQAGALQALCRRAGTEVVYVKPHGALYHATLAGGPHEGAVRELCRLLGLPLLLQRDGDVTEGFADRGYGPDGLLLPRGSAGALLGADEAAAQAVRLAADGIRSVCVHSDTPGADVTLRAVRAALEGAGHEIRSFA